MTKKTILISTIFAVAMMFGLTSIVSAAGDDVVFGADTSVPVYLIGTTSASDLVVAADSQAAGIAIGTDRVTVTLESGSDITFKSASNEIMNVAGCTATYATFTPGSPSTMRIVYNAACTSAVLTIGTGTLTEANVAATPLTEATASTYTVTFRTVGALISGDIIQLDFGTRFTVAANNTTASNVTTLTDDGTDISTGISLSTGTSNQIKITLNSAVAAGSVMNIVLNSALVTNPATATSDTALSGIDIYTTTAAGVVIDSLANQTAFNAVLDLPVGWSVFAPSQALEATSTTVVLTPISGSYSAIYTLAWASGTSTMTWQTPSNIQPLYGYVIYNSTGSTLKLPLDFAKETVTNSTFSRDLDYKGWYLIGYAGSSASLVAQTYCLDGLTVAGQEEFSTIIDLTGTTADGTLATSHAVGDATSEVASIGSAAMAFTKNYGYGVFTTADGLVLGGEREE
jgi:hypothetical protein